MATLDAKTQADLADMALALAHNPETRRGFAALAKTAKLPVTFHDVEAENASLAAAGKVADDRIAAARQADETAAMQRRLAASRDALVTSGRFTADTVTKELEPFMAARGIGSYEDGAILYAHEHPHSQPHAEIASGRMWEMPKGDWVKDPQGTARKTAHQVIAEIAAARR